MTSIVLGAVEKRQWRPLHQVLPASLSKPQTQLAPLGKPTAMDRTTETTERAMGDWCVPTVLPVRLSSPRGHREYGLDMWLWVLVESGRGGRCTHIIKVLGSFHDEWCPLVLLDFHPALAEELPAGGAGVSLMPEFWGDAPQL